jgi:amino acid transporter
VTVLAPRLTLWEAVGMSISVICPTVTAAFNVTLVAQAAGAAAALAFAIGTVAMLLVAASFVFFARRVAHAGAAYAYITQTFGPRAGFIAGWSLLLTYLAFATGQAALVGSFAAAALQGFSIDLGKAWIGVGACAIVLAWWLAFRDMRLAGRLMLALEVAAVTGILALCVRILSAVRPGLAITAASFRPSSHFGGWSGMGFGMVFCILSFGGFEGAATLGEETRNPRRAIPIALLGTVIGSGVFFVFVAYCEVVGFGPAGIGDLGKSAAPLNDLALRYASPQLAIALDVAAALSCFSGLLGPLAAAARVAFALGRGGLAPALSRVHPVHGTPVTAVALAALAIAVPFVVWAPLAGAGDYYSYTATIGTLLLIVVYLGVGAAATRESWRARQPSWATVCVLGPVLLLWVLYRNIYPVPEYPNNLWPYVALVWVLMAWGVIQWRPAVMRRVISEWDAPPPT